MLEAYEDFITPEELCEILHIGRNAAYRLLSTGRLGAFRVGRVWKIPKEGLIEFVRAGYRE